MDNVIRVKMKTYIICHNQDIILECKADNRFKNLNEYTYILVGTGENDKLTDIKHIVARDYSNHLEDKKQYVAFTAWWLLAKNPELLDDYLLLLEYDTFPHLNFIELINDYQNKDVIQFLPLPLDFENYLTGFNPIFELIKSFYKIDYKQILGESMINGYVWGSSSNQGMKKDVLIDFVEWYEKLMPFIENDVNCKYYHERAFMLYILYKNYNIVNINCLTHFYKDSHNGN